MPKQKIKTTQDAIKADCAKEMRKLPKGAMRLGLFDPPYNFGMPYDSYDDNKSYDEYMAWTRNWMDAAVHALHRNGSMFIFVPDEWVSEIDMLARHEFKLYKRRHIVWTFTFGVACAKNFARSHCHILYLTKAKTAYTFNADDKELRHPSARQLVYNDKRANPDGCLPDATWMILKEQLEPYMTPDRDTWLVSRICGTFKERKKHLSNQIPLPLWDRIIRATSNEGDLVVDGFMGTGGSGVVATRLNRNYLGYDISPVAVQEATTALEAARELAAPQAKPKKKTKKKAA